VTFKATTDAPGIRGVGRLTVYCYSSANFCPHPCSMKQLTDERAMCAERRRLKAGNRHRPGSVGIFNLFPMCLREVVGTYSFMITIGKRPFKLLHVSIIRLEQFKQLCIRASEVCEHRRYKARSVMMLPFDGVSKKRALIADAAMFR